MQNLVRYLLNPAGALKPVEFAAPSQRFQGQQIERSGRDLASMHSMAFLASLDYGRNKRLASRQLAFKLSGRQALWILIWRPLLDWRRQAFYSADSDFVFVGDIGRPRWQGMILKDHIQPTAAKAGIGKVGWHTFRHSYRAWLKRFATPAEIQKELMRHSNLRTTLEIYGI